MLLMCGMFSFSIAEAQVCDCTNGQPGYCYVDSHGNARCERYKPHGNCHGCTIIDPHGIGIGIETSLFAYPNPGSSSTSISFFLEQSLKISLRIFDMNGRLVKILTDATLEAGDHEITWNASDVNAGIYFVQLQSEENQERLKLIVTK